MFGVKEICRAQGLMEGVVIVIVTQGINQSPTGETLKWRQEEMSCCWPGGVEWEWRGREF